MSILLNNIFLLVKYFNYKKYEHGMFTYKCFEQQMSLYIRVDINLKHFFI